MLGKNVVHSKNIPYESESDLGSTGESFGNAAVVDPYVGATEEDAVLIIVDEPVEYGGLLHQFKIKLKKNAFGLESDLANTTWPYTKNGLGNMHLIAYNKSTVNNVEGFIGYDRVNVTLKLVYEIQSVEVNPPLRVETGMYVGIAMESLNLCYKKDEQLGSVECDGPDKFQGMSI